ncbi:MAG: hypothetical protein Q8M02_07380 [Candidatus Didemnitutus sp.]|nr:hypothetical protein [Candidatus Didemnitutus sp.]
MNTLVMTRILKLLGVVWGISVSVVAIGQVYFPVSTPRFQTAIHVERTKNSDGTHSLSVTNSSMGNQIALSVLGGATSVEVPGHGLFIERTNGVSFRAEMLPASGWRVSGSRLIRPSDVPTIARWASSTQNGDTVDFVVNFREKQPQGLTVVGGYFEKVEDNPAGTVTEAVFIGAHVMLADLDVDSMNTGSVTFDSESDKVEHPEIGSDKPGKILVFQTRADTDGDGIEDFRQFTPCGAQPFAGMTLFLDGLPSGSKMRFLYSGSDPEKIVKKTVNGVDVYEPAPGHLRVWNVNNDKPRNPTSFNAMGNYLPPNVAFSLDDLRKRARNGPDNPGEGHFIFYIEPIAISEKLADQTVTAQVQLPGAAADWITIDTVAFTVTQMSIAADTDRAGKIDFVRDRKAAAKTPFRFWINDDDDDGDEANQTLLGGNSDEPGKLSGWFEFDGRTPDHAKTGVDGRCDLIDLFPVYLDIKQLLTVLPHTTAGNTYKLKQGDSGLNIVYTDLARDHAFDYLTKEDAVYGTGMNRLPHLAETTAITAEGAPLSVTFLDKIKNGTDKGVILVEGTKATDKPLRLVVEKGGAVIAEISLNIKISEVEKMYRWVNLRGAAGQSEKRPTNTNEPENYPDNRTNGKMFIWLHGYNVNEQQSRAWNAEAFKRLYQSGSRAMFTAVTWHGDHSQIPLIGVAPDYWENITHAFKTSAVLPAAVSALPGSSKIIVGHSMGNVVVASAIKDHGLSVTKYFMLNAAVALEAFDTNAMSIDAMRHQNWATYDPHLWATEWYQLFPGEGRAGLTWRNRFGDISNAINFYSSGEEVLNNNDAASGGTPGQVPPIGGERAWVLQEMVKGTRHIYAVLTFDSQGGWGFNGHWDISETTTTHGPHGGTTTTYRHLDPTEANGLTNDELKAQPFFRRFQNTALLGANGSTTASEYLVRADALGTAIPALSFPTGRNPIPLFDQQDRNVNLMDLKNGWPRSAGRWLHSDAKNVAYRYNHKLWEKWVDDGGLR